MKSRTLLDQSKRCVRGYCRTLTRPVIRDGHRAHAGEQIEGLQRLTLGPLKIRGHD